MGLRTPRFGWLMAIAAVLACVDQGVKWLVAARLVELERIPVLPFFDLVRWHNTGAAFGLFSSASGWQNAMFLVLGLVILALIVLMLRNASAHGDWFWAVGLSLMAGGAGGNLIDRVARGYVLDFVSLHYNDWHFPAFNVADSSITVGVILVLASALFSGRGKSTA